MLDPASTPRSTSLHGYPIAAVLGVVLGGIFPDARRSTSLVASVVPSTRRRSVERSITGGPRNGRAQLCRSALRS